MFIADIGFPNIGDLWNGFVSILTNAIPNMLNVTLIWIGQAVLGVIYTISGAIGGVLSSLLPVFGVGHEITDPTSLIPSVYNQAHAWDVIAPVHEIMAGVVLAVGIIAAMYIWSLIMFIIQMLKGIL